MDLTVNDRVYVVIDPGDPHSDDYPTVILSKENLMDQLKTNSIRSESTVYEVQVRKKFKVAAKLILNLIDSTKK
jgi:hypothetical protein